MPPAGDSFPTCAREFHAVRPASSLRRGPRMKRPAKQELPTPQRRLATIDLATLQTVSGGAINWRYYAYTAGIKMSSWDPARVASNFLM